ncbi:MAG: hypothetical protein HQL73_02160 [Magnetococcales bacterium]|nr:hypothetical protein [Magnetococcales bacterium]
MTTPVPPPNITAQSNDNRIGFLFISGIAIIYGAWSLSPGPFFAFGGVWSLVLAIPGVFLVIVAIRRLLRPGCKMLLRVNHGGVTDFRLSERAVPWGDIVGVTMTRGWVGLLLPAVVLELVPGQGLPAERTLWCRFLHAFLSPLFPDRLLILCATLDIDPHEIHRVVLHHVHHHRKEKEF